jgi:hypothetical protein
MLSNADAAIANCLRMLSSDVEVNEGHYQIAERISKNSDNLQLLIQNANRRAKKKNASNGTES